MEQAAGINPITFLLISPLSKLIAKPCVRQDTKHQPRLFFQGSISSMYMTKTLPWFIYLLKGSRQPTSSKRKDALRMRKGREEQEKQQKFVPKDVPTPFLTAPQGFRIEGTQHKDKKKKTLQISSHDRGASVDHLSKPLT